MSDDRYSDCSFIDLSEEMEFEDSIIAESSVRSFPSSSFSDGVESETYLSGVSDRSIGNFPKEKEKTSKHEVKRDTYLGPSTIKPVSILFTI